MIRVIIVDDEPDIRAALRMILEAENDISVVAEAGDSERAVALARRIPSDLALIDVHMPGEDGIETTRRILALPHPPKVLILTAFNIEANVVAGLAAGASGFLLKGVQPGELPRAIRTTVFGGSVLDPAAAPAVINRAIASVTQEAERELSDDLSDLTAREREFMAAVGHGMSNAQLAAHFSLSPASTKTYVSRLLYKLGLANRTQLAIAAHKAGLIE